VKKNIGNLEHNCKWEQGWKNIVSAEQITTTEETKFKPRKKSRLRREQKINPGNKLWLEKMKQKYSISRTNQVYGGNKKFGHGTN
jgi:hypothetical protein